MAGYSRLSRKWEREPFLPADQSRFGWISLAMLTFLVILVTLLLPHSEYCSIAQLIAP
jgi:hypothetical protein